MKKYQVFDKDGAEYFYRAQLVETHEGELWGYDENYETIWILPKGQWTELRLVQE